LTRWTTPAALAIAVLAVAIAIAAWFRPAHQSASPAFTSQQTAKAKTNVCSAYTAVHQMVVTNTNLENPVDGDPIGQLAIATDARLALLGGSAYLRNRLAADPASPADLAKAVQAMADTTEQLGIGYLGETSDVDLNPLRRNIDSKSAHIDALCK
jgi:3D (Asp-Asp-Asp) domain-containing protein